VDDASQVNARKMNPPDKFIPRPLPTAFAIALLICLIGNFFLARTAPQNADLLQAYSQVHDIRSGNLLLHGWMQSSDNFYFTDLLIMAVLSYIFGAGAPLIYIAPYFLFCLLLLGSMLLVARSAETRSQKYFAWFAVLFLLGMPFGPLEDEFFQSDVHVATIVFSLYAILLIEPGLSGRVFRYWMLIPFSGLIFAVTASDPLADVFLTAPLCGFILLRTWLSQRFLKIECAIFASTLACAFLGGLFPAFLKAHNGFSIVPNFSMSGVPLHDMRQNARGVLGAFQLLLAARSDLLPGIAAYRLTGITRGAAGCCMAALAFWTLIRLPARLKNALPQFLAFSALILVFADVLSKNFTIAVQDGVLFPGPAIRYAVPAFVFLILSGIIAAQRLGPVIRNIHVQHLLCGAACIAVIPSVLSGAQIEWADSQQPSGAAAAAQTKIVYWLLAHHFSYGTGDYWTSQAIGPLSEGKLKTAPAIAQNGKLVAFAWNADQSLWAQMQPPQFVAFANGNAFGVELRVIEATYGPPIAVYSIDGFSVVQLLRP
jgi:hypothetical protein